MIMFPPPTLAPKFDTGTSNSIGFVKCCTLAVATLELLARTARAGNWPSRGLKQGAEGRAWRVELETFMLLLVRSRRNQRHCEGGRHCALFADCQRVA
jgi:hypothetical protein